MSMIREAQWLLKGKSYTGRIMCLLLGTAAKLGIDTKWILIKSASECWIIFIICNKATGQ